MRSKKGPDLSAIKHLPVKAIDGIFCIFGFCELYEGDAPGQACHVIDGYVHIPADNRQGWDGQGSYLSRQSGE